MEIFEKPAAEADKARCDASGSIASAAAGGGGGGRSSGGCDVVLPDDIGEDVKSALFDNERNYDKAGCVACRRGTNGAAPIPIEALNNLIRNYVENRGYKDPEDLAVDLAEQFEKCIRQPANARLQPGEEPIPLFTAEDIYVHMKYHDQEPAVWTQNTLEMLGNIREQIYQGQLFRAPRVDAPPGGTAGDRRAFATSTERYAQLRPQDVRVHEKSLRMLTELVKLEASLYRTDPSKMFMYSKQRTVRIEDTPRPWVNGRKPMYTETRPAGDTWAKVTGGY